MPELVENFAPAAAPKPTRIPRPLAKQQTALQAWLESNGKIPTASGIPAKHPSPLLTKSVHRPQSDEKVATLRDALAANGLALAPGLHQLPALHKVVRVEDLLRLGS